MNTIIKIVLAVSLLVASSASVAADGLLDRHLGAGLTCTNCHAVDHGAPAETPRDIVEGTCIACHGTMLGPDDAPAPQISSPNPHISPHLAAGEIPQCTSCHRVHGPGEVTCTSCHRRFDFKLD